MKRTLAMLLAVFLTACGGGSPTTASTAATAVAVAPKPAFSPSIVVFEGDSLTQISAVTSWPTAVQADSKWSAEWENFAIGGTTTTMMLARYDAVHSSRPIGRDGVFVFDGGANDLRLPPGEDDPAAAIYGRLKTMWAQARADGFKVVAFTVHNGSSFISADFARAQYARLNAMIRADASLYDALVENDKLFPDPADTTLLIDTVHFTPAANEKERTAVEAALSSLK